MKVTISRIHKHEVEKALAEAISRGAKQISEIKPSVNRGGEIKAIPTQAKINKTDRRRMAEPFDHCVKWYVVVEYPKRKKEEK